MARLSSHKNRIFDLISATHLPSRIVEPYLYIYLSPQDRKIYEDADKTGHLPSASVTEKLELYIQMCPYVSVYVLLQLLPSCS